MPHPFTLIKLGYLARSYGVPVRVRIQADVGTIRTFNLNRQVW